MKIITLCCTIVFTLLFNRICAQEKLYDVVFSGKKVGHLKVFDIGSEAANAELQKIESNFKLFFYSGSYLIESYLEGGALHSSNSAHHVNGDLKGKTVTTKDVRSNYKVQFTGDEAPKIATKELNFDIRNTVTGLYYKEPSEIKHVYSERYGKLCNLKKVSPNTYSVELPEGKEAFYVYANGQLKEVLTYLAGFKLKIVLKEGK